MKTPSTTFKVNIDAASARVLRPDPLRIDELALPGLHVSKEIGNDLVLLVGHAAPKMGDALVRLLAVAEVLREHRREAALTQREATSTPRRWRGALDDALRRHRRNFGKFKFSEDAESAPTAG